MTTTLTAVVVPPMDKAEHLLDASGLFCPEPVMLLHNKIRDMAVGELLQVVATDPSTARDIPKFCNFLGHELLVSEEADGKYRYLLRKCQGAHDG